MYLSYSSLKDEDIFALTDFTCEVSLDLLNRGDLYKVLWANGGDIKLMVDHYQIELAKDQLLFCTPLNIIEVLDNSSQVTALVFNKEFFCIQNHDEQVSCHGFLFFGSSDPQRVMLVDKQLENFTLMIAMFKEDLNIKDHLQGEMLRSLLKRLLIQSTRLAKESLPQPAISNANLNVIREYNILVEKHFRKMHNVKDYADLLHKSPKTLSNLFPKYSDKSPLMVINERILLEARRLLLYSDKSTMEVADELGYKDPGHFSKFFKKHEGLSPSQFRKERSLALH